MYESTKTRLVRGADFDSTYFIGSVLDIGSGYDVVVPHAEAFDQQQGDANNILEHLQPHSYDTVNSSHCLEHMHHPEKVLQDWWQLVKPGGYLVTVVPHEDLYEQGQWPSRFNSDHKATFRLDSSSWSPCSHDLLKLSEALPGAQLISADIQDDNYNYDIMSMGEETDHSRIIRLRHSELIHRLLTRNLCSLPVLDELNLFMANLGATVDQTIGSALAQIQVIVRKSADDTV
jgi:SAM-dependent methyltransferase